MNKTTRKLKAHQFKLSDSLEGGVEALVDMWGKKPMLWDRAPELVGYIYIIKNIVNNHRYIGMTRNVAIRKKQHIMLLQKNRHPNAALQEDFICNGEESFLFGIVEFVYCSPYEDNPEYVPADEVERKLLNREIYWMDRFNSRFPNGYNESSEVSKQRVENLRNFIQAWKEQGKK